MGFDSGFDNKSFSQLLKMKLIGNCNGGTCNCYQMRIHGKLHFVKEIKKEFLFNERMRAAFRKENELGYSLSHPNLPKYVFLDGFLSPEEYVVTEWIEGTTLDKFIEINPKYFKDKNNVTRFIYQLAGGLDYLHLNGIIHGDLKPSNIMLSFNGKKAFIIDLGYTVSDAHTLTGGFSPLFASPEVLRGETPNTYNDYYSFGKILNYIRQNADSSHFSINIRKQIDNLIIGDERKKETAYNKLREYKSESGRFIIPAIVFIFLSVGLAWFIWPTYNENRNLENPIYENDTLRERGIISKTEFKEKEIEKELKDGGKVSKIDVTKKDDKDLDYPKSSIKSNEEELNTPEIKNKELKEERNNLVSRLNPRYLYPPVDAELENKVKLEVQKLLNNYYPPLIAKIDYLMENRIYTKEWGDSLMRLHNKGVAKCLNILDYEEKFPQISRQDLFEIVGDESQKYFKENLNEKIFGYYNIVEKIEREKSIKNL